MVEFLFSEFVKERMVRHLINTDSILDWALKLSIQILPSSSALTLSSFHMDTSSAAFGVVYYQILMSLNFVSALFGLGNLSF